MKKNRVARERGGRGRGGAKVDELTRLFFFSVTTRASHPPFSLSFRLPAFSSLPLSRLSRVAPFPRHADRSLLPRGPGPPRCRSLGRRPCCREAAASGAPGASVRFFFVSVCSVNSVFYLSFLFPPTPPIATPLQRFESRLPDVDSVELDVTKGVEGGFVALEVVSARGAMPSRSRRELLRKGRGEDWLKQRFCLFAFFFPRPSALRGCRAIFSI